MDDLMETYENESFDTGLSDTYHQASDSSIHLHHDSVSFGRLLDEIPDDGSILAPYDIDGSREPFEILRNPLGIYTIKNVYALNDIPDVEFFERYELPSNYTLSDIQNACNRMCDSLHWDHIPVNITTSVENAQWSSGMFLHSTFDDVISLNPDYASSCIEHIGTTDIVLSDLAHEIGHSMAFNICGNMNTRMNEKMADFISGFANAKMGLDIDAARKWFEWYYDPQGCNGYPISEERWDSEAAGYYFGTLVNGDVLQKVLKDESFIELIDAYSQDKIEFLNNSMWNSDFGHLGCAEESHMFKDYMQNTIKSKLHNIGSFLSSLLNRLY